MYSNLINPYQEFLPKELIIIPDGYLCYIPFEAFIKEPNYKPYQFAKHDYLIKSKAISYAYSLYMWHWSQNQKRPFKQSNKVLCLAPSFDGENWNYSPLYYNQIEVETVLNQYKGKKLENSDGIKQKFLEEAPNYAVLLLSTHGIINDEDPELSNLVFSPNNTRENLHFIELIQQKTQLRISHIKCLSNQPRKTVHWRRAYEYGKSF